MMPMSPEKRPGRLVIRLASLLFAALLAPIDARAQNAISEGGWQGFALRDADNHFERCVLYNRTIPALNASPYEMLGLTRDAAGQIGLFVFYAPRTLVRGERPVRLTFDQRASFSAGGAVISDFHVQVPKLEPDAVAALRAAKSIEATVEGKSITFELAGVSAALDRLESCVQEFSTKG
jgi:hypothetical protein